jgi:protein kinase A
MSLLKKLAAASAKSPKESNVLVPKSTSNHINHALSNENVAHDSSLNLSEFTPSGERRVKYSLSDFIVERTLGTGSFGRVHLVKTKKTESKCSYWALKVLKKSEIVRMKQVEHTINEKNILDMLEHPFLISMLVRSFFFTATFRGHFRTPPIFTLQWNLFQEESYFPTCVVAG